MNLLADSCWHIVSLCDVKLAFKLTENVLGAQFVQIPELIVTVEDRRASDNGHQDHVSCIVFRLKLVRRTRRATSPVPALVTLMLRTSWHRSIVLSTSRCRSSRSRPSSATWSWWRRSDDRLNVRALAHHAQGQGDYRDNHLPGVGGAEFTVCPEELTHHDSITRSIRGDLARLRRFNCKERKHTKKSKTDQYL